MSSFFPVLMLVGVGAMIAVHATLNGALGRVLGLTLFAVVFSIAQTLFSLPGLLVGSASVRWADLARVPWWHHIGAALGVFILMGISYGTLS